MSVTSGNVAPNSSLISRNSIADWRVASSAGDIGASSTTSLEGSSGMLIEGSVIELRGYELVPDLVVDESVSMVNRQDKDYASEP